MSYIRQLYDRYFGTNNNADPDKGGVAVSGIIATPTGNEVFPSAFSQLVVGGHKIFLDEQDMLDCPVALLQVDNFVSIGNPVNARKRLIKLPPEGTVRLSDLPGTNAEIIAEYYEEFNFQGQQGIQGIQGVQGIQGLQGLQGPQGNPGPQGIKGDTGEQGIQGIHGEPGIDGIDGVNGGSSDIKTEYEINTTEPNTWRTPTIGQTLLADAVSTYHLHDSLGTNVMVVNNSFLYSGYQTITNDDSIDRLYVVTAHCVAIKSGSATMAQLGLFAITHEIEDTEFPGTYIEQETLMSMSDYSMDTLDSYGTPINHSVWFKIKPGKSLKVSAAVKCPVGSINVSKLMVYSYIAGQ
jgi:hypothetical protein